jgi:PST family polysaccharide transporter
VGEVVVRGIVGIALALAGLGPWSLVLGYLSGTLTWTVLLWSIVTWRPKLAIHRADLPLLVRFGGMLTVVGIIGTAMSYVDNLAVGRVLGATALGLYSVGFRLPEMLIADVLAAAGLVLFPGFALLEGRALSRAVVTASRYAFLISFPAAAILVTLADPIVIAFFGRRWLPAAAVIQILAIGFLAGPLARVTGSAYMATKRVDVMLKLAVPQGVLLVVLLVLFVHDGINATAACQTAVRLLFIPIGLVVAVRVLGIGVGAIWRAAWPPLLAAAGMAATIVLIKQIISSAWPLLLVGCTVGTIVYFGLVWVFAGDVLKSLWTLLRSRRAPPPGLAAAAPEHVEPL